MAGRVRFTVTDRDAPQREARPLMRQVAEEVAADAADGTPVVTGMLRDGWKVEGGPGEPPRIVNDVEYVFAVEFGGPRNPIARAMLGRALARARARYG